MKTIMAIGALGIFAAGSIANATPLFSNKTINIMFDTFCDGMQLVINTNTGVVTGERTGSCVTTQPVRGHVVSHAKSGLGLVVHTTHGDGTGSLQYLIDDTPRKMSLTSDTGLVQTDTYSVGIPAIEAVYMGPVSGE